MLGNHRELTRMTVVIQTELRVGENEYSWEIGKC